MQSGTATGWTARLSLRYARDGARTVAHDAHHGPLRVLKALHPEGPGICHHVVVHPPGGVVGGDELHVDVEVGRGAHALLTTPGATRFYRSEGHPARQQVRLALAADARLEWLPLETIAHPGCIAESRLSMTLQPGAETIGWDLVALGLPASGEPFERGRFALQLAWPGHWLERGTLDASDTALLDGPAGLAGHRLLGTLWWAAGTPPPAPRRDALLEAARACVDAAAPSLHAGVTSPQPGLVLLRVLARRVEPAMALLQAVRAAWRQAGWGLPPAAPRIWRT